MSLVLSKGLTANTKQISNILPLGLTANTLVLLVFIPFAAKLQYLKTADTCKLIDLATLDSIANVYVTSKAIIEENIQVGSITELNYLQTWLLAEVIKQGLYKLAVLAEPINIKTI